MAPVTSEALSESSQTMDFATVANNYARRRARTCATHVLIRRQALHAFRLSFKHPGSGIPMTFEAPLAADFQATLEALRRHSTD